MPATSAAITTRAPGFSATQTVDGNAGAIDLLRLINDDDGSVGDSSVVIDKLGHVLIGTTAGTEELTVYATSFPNAQFINSTTGTTSSDGTFMGLASDGSFIFNNKENEEIIIKTLSLDRLKIQANGNIDIGAANAADTQSPRLSITSDADSDGSAATTELFIIDIVASATPTNSMWHFNSSQGLGYSFDKPINYGVETQADDDYEITIPGLTALYTGLTVTFIATTANTGGATLEITTIGDIDALVIADAASVATALDTNEILAGQVVTAVFDGTNWQVTSRLAIDRN